MSGGIEALEFESSDDDNVDLGRIEKLTMRERLSKKDWPFKFHPFSDIVNDIREIHGRFGMVTTFLFSTICSLEGHMIKTNFNQFYSLLQEIPRVRLYHT
jgi:hypothetical protein